MGIPRDPALSALQQQALLDELMAALPPLIRELRFGSIEIVFHEGKVTYMERRERVRLGGASALARC